MTILSAIQSEISQLSRSCKFYYEDLDQANANIFDKISAGEFPVCLILPFDIQDVSRENGVIRSTAEVNALFLDKVAQLDPDKPSLDIENEVVAPMRAIAREFLNRLDLNDIIDEDGITSNVNRSVHQGVSDAHLYGCWVIFTVKFTENISLCVPDQ
jgi:hypothetical protein